MFRFGDPGGRIYTSVGASNVNLLSHWTAIVGGNTNVSVSAGNGRNGGSCLRHNNSNSVFISAITKTLDNSQATLGIAFAFRLNTMPGNATCIARFYDNGTTQCDLRINTDGTVFVTRNGTSLGTLSTVVIATNVYYHIECKITFHPSAGLVDVWVNGVSRLSLTSQNTRNSANSSANQVGVGAIIGPNGLTYNYDFDDIIVYDGQATDANGFADITGPIGDCGLVWLLPTGAGTTTQFTPDSGSNFARVNEATPDGNTSYVDNGTIGQIDTYAIADLGGTASLVKSLAVVSYARKTDAGSRGMKTELRSAGANVANAAEIALADSFLYYFQTWGQDPNNGSPINWTPTSVNAVEAGQVVSS